MKYLQKILAVIFIYYLVNYFYQDRKEKFKEFRELQTASINHSKAIDEKEAKKNIYFQKIISDKTTPSDIKAAFKIKSNSEVPWDELHKRWMSNVKEYIIALDPVKGSKIFRSYSKARKIYLEKYQQSKLQMKKLRVIADAKKQTRKIFGIHYPQVQNFYMDFSDSIQVYSREMPISIDFTFED